jgi:sterol desaturase/sphingolipid hydroxylase (fatty acid hydroxylase superfamily)
MREPVLLAIPFFVILLTIEWVAARKLEHVEAPDEPGRPASGAYFTRDAWASVSMGLVSIATMGAWKFLALLGYAALYAYVAPWHLSPTKWYTWVVAIVGLDLLFYAAHRTAHRVRVAWASHQAHHSSRYFNFATALRQKWNNSVEILWWIPLPLLGLPPWMVFTSFSISLIYQFWIHTERIGKLPRPIEFVFNTPSHHRVHHGMDREYLDKNYAGIFIIWDRMFGTFQAEMFRPHYGLTKPVDTFNPWKLQTHEYVAIARDVRRATKWRDRLGYIFGPPGWQPTSTGSRHEPVSAASLPR